MNSLLTLFYDGGSYHIEIIPLICKENKWTGFIMIGTPVMEELKISVLTSVIAFAL